MNRKVSVIVLVCSLVLAFVGWATTLDTWAAGLSPKTLSGLLAGLAGIVLAWLGQSPLKAANQIQVALSPPLSLDSYPGPSGPCCLGGSTLPGPTGATGALGPIGLRVPPPSNKVDNL